MVKHFRNKPVVVEGVQWTGDNLDEITEFVGGDSTDVMKMVGTDLQIWNAPEVQWISVPKGHWIIKGVAGEFYPIEDSILWKTKEAVEEGS